MEVGEGRKCDTQKIVFPDLDVGVDGREPSGRGNDGLDHM